MTNVDTEIFAEAERLEFQTSDLRAARNALSTFASSTDPRVRAEALLRLARVASKSGDVSEALANYAKIADETSLSPLGAPYGLLSRFARCQLLANAHQEAAARPEAVQLAASLQSGRWRIGKEAYVYYSNELRKLTEPATEDPGLNEKLAVAEIVGSAWDEWQLFQHSGSRSLTKHLHASGPKPALAVLDANPERMVALIYGGDSISHLGLSPREASGDNGVRAFIADEDGRLLVGSMPDPADLQAKRSCHQ